MGDAAEDEGGRSAVKRMWNSDEDEALRRLVDHFGDRNWKLISAAIPGRTPRACRSRWLNCLSPNVVRGPFTADEDEIIIAAQAKHGNRWATIARLLPGRTGPAVEYRWCTMPARDRWTESSDSAAREPTTSLPIGPHGDEEAPAASGGGGDQRENEEMKAYLMSRRR